VLNVKQFHTAAKVQYTGPRTPSLGIQLFLSIHYSINWAAPIPIPVHWCREMKTEEEFGVNVHKKLAT